MMNTKNSYKHDNMHCIRENYTLKYFYNDGNECINDMLSLDSRNNFKYFFYEPCKYRL